MPFYDLGCPSCQRAEVDTLLRVSEIKACPQCGTAMVRVWVTKPANVIGDECDVWQENGFHTPRHFTSKAERARALSEKGLDPHYSKHVTLPGTDKHPETTDWSKGSIDPYTMAAAAALVARPAEPKLRFTVSQVIQGTEADCVTFGIPVETDPLPVTFTVREVIG